jgi:hypothetical protein
MTGVLGFCSVQLSDVYIPDDDVIGASAPAGRRPNDARERTDRDRCRASNRTR